MLYSAEVVFVWHNFLQLLKSIITLRQVKQKIVLNLIYKRNNSEVCNSEFKFFGSLFFHFYGILKAKFRGGLFTEESILAHTLFLVSFNMSANANIASKVRVLRDTYNKLAQIPIPLSGTISQENDSLVQVIFAQIILFK